MGFTLAEVLITLSIIGVVAALTIPSVVVKNEKKALAVQFSKSFSNLSSMLSIAQAQYGPLTSWDWQNDANGLIENNILSLLNTTKICDVNEESCGDKINYADLNKNRVESFFKKNIIRAVSADGALWGFDVVPNCILQNVPCALIRVDVNGSKKPNVFGRDVFTFYLLPFTNQVLPEGVYAYGSRYDSTNGWKYNSIEEVEQNCNIPSIVNSSGAGGMCPAKLIKDGFNMNY